MFVQVGAIDEESRFAEGESWRRESHYLALPAKQHRPSSMTTMLAPSGTFLFEERASARVDQRVRCDAVLLRRLEEMIE